MVEKKEVIPENKKSEKKPVEAKASTNSTLNKTDCVNTTSSSNI